MTSSVPTANERLPAPPVSSAGWSVGGGPVTFTNPLFLLALPALAVPVIIHLSQRRTPERTVFPAAALITSSAMVVRSRRSLTEVLLLVLRCLVVVGVLLALSRPRVTGWGSPDRERALASAAVVLDDTPSMGASAGEGTRMARALAAVESVMDRLEPGSQLRIETPSGVVLDGGVDLEAARELLGGIGPSDVAAPMAGALEGAVRWLGDSPPPSELYVLSDFQETTWEGARRLPAVTDIAVHYVDLGDKSHSDWAVTDVRVDEDRVFKAVPFTVRCRADAGASGDRALVLELGGLSGREAGRRPAALVAGESEGFSFECALPESGAAVGSVRLEGSDSWPASDVRGFAVEALPAARVLCVSGPSGEGRLAGDVLALSLAPFPTGERELAAVVKTQCPLPAEAELAGFDCVVLAAPSAVPAPDWPRLARYVEDGGGLLVFADAGMTDDRFWSLGGGLLPARGGRLAEGGVSRLVGIDFDHPVLRTFAEGGNGAIELVHFSRHLELSAEGADGSKVLARFSGGPRPSPALVASSRGRGRVLLLAASPVPSWGSLYREPAFVPFVHEAVAHLARAAPAGGAHIAGDRVTVLVTPEERGAEAVLERRDVDPPARWDLEVDPETLEVHVGRVEERGVYHLVTSWDGRSRERILVYELDPAEFSPRRTDPSGVLGPTAGGVRDPEELSRVVARKRGGRELAPLVLKLVLGLFIAEMLVAARLTRRRSSAPGQSANLEGAI